MKKKFTFRKSERLCSTKLLGKLFAEGKSFLYYPIKVVYLLHELKPDFPVQAAFAVSRKNFRKASSRNNIRRKMKELYRLNKQELIQIKSGLCLSMMFIYISNEISGYDEIEKSIKSSIARLNQILKAANNVREKPSG